MNKEARKYIRVKKIRRAARVRAKIKGTPEVPRLSVFRSNKFIWAQVIDDAAGITMLAVSEKETKVKGTKTEKSGILGALLAEKCAKAGITKLVFDRGEGKFHGRIKEFAEALRAQGLKF